MMAIQSVAMHRRQSALLAGVVWLSTLAAQAPPREVVIRTHSYTPPSMILRAEANLVETGLTVRDANGRAVGGLHASDFEVLDNGTPKRITAFSELRSDGKPTTAASAKSRGAVPLASVPPTGPKYVTFFYDDFHMSSATALFVKHAAHAYIDKGLEPSERLSIVTASGQGDLDFTNDAKRFAERLDHLAAWPPRGSRAMWSVSHRFLHLPPQPRWRHHRERARDCRELRGLRPQNPWVPSSGLRHRAAGGQLGLGADAGAIDRYARRARFRRQATIRGERNAYSGADFARFPAAAGRAARAGEVYRRRSSLEHRGSRHRRAGSRRDTRNVVP